MTTKMYSPKHAKGTMPRTQPGGQVNASRHLSTDQFPGHSSGSTNWGVNPFSYQGGSHRIGAGGRFNM